MKIQLPAWSVLVLLNGLGLCVLGFYSTTGAAPGAQPPFQNSVEQRSDMVRELREIKELLKEQNALLLRGAPKADATGTPKR